MPPTIDCANALLALKPETALEQVLSYLEVTKTGLLDLCGINRWYGTRLTTLSVSSGHLLRILYVVQCEYRGKFSGGMPVSINWNDAHRLYLGCKFYNKIAAKPRGLPEGVYVDASGQYRKRVHGDEGWGSIPFDISSISKGMLIDGGLPLAPVGSDMLYNLHRTYLNDSSKTPVVNLHSFNTVVAEMRDIWSEIQGIKPTIRVIADAIGVSANSLECWLTGKKNRAKVTSEVMRTMIGVQMRLIVGGGRL